MYDNTTNYMTIFRNEVFLFPCENCVIFAARIHIVTSIVSWDFAVHAIASEFNEMLKTNR